MPLKMDYTTLPEMKSYLRITTTDEDTVLPLIITAASDWIDQYCGRSFGSAAQTRVFNGFGRKTLDVSPSIVAITSLETMTYEGAAFAVVPATDYVLQPDAPDENWPFTTISFKRFPTTSQNYFTSGLGTVRITGTFGWATVPASVAEACRQLVGAIWKRRQAGPLDTIGETSTGMPVVGRLVPEFTRMALNKYRSVVMASTAQGVVYPV